MKRAEERGPIGQWAREQRLKRNWTPEELVTQLAKVGGPRMQPASYRGIESGARRASGATQAGLERLFGEPPPRETANLDDLVTAISELVAELRLDREARLGIEEGQRRAAEILAGLQRAAESPAESQSPQPPGTGRGSPEEPGDR